jgi:hypothetical protein
VSESRAEPGGPTAEQLVEELRKVKVGEMIVHTCSMLASLAYGKLAPETRDLADAQLAIDALRALTPFVPESDRAGIQQVVTNLQLAYASAAAG